MIKLTDILNEAPTVDSVFQKVPFGGGAIPTNIDVDFIKGKCAELGTTPKSRDLLLRIVKTYNAKHPGKKLTSIPKYLATILKNPEKNSLEIKSISPDLYTWTKDNDVSGEDDVFYDENQLYINAKGKIGGMHPDNFCELVNDFDISGINRDRDYEYDDFGNFTKATRKFKFPYEPNTKAEEELMQALSDWYDGSNAWSASVIKKYYPAIKSAMKIWPKIFSTGLTEKTPVYRGLTGSNKLYKLLKKTDLKDWKRTADGAYVYTKSINYTPRRVVQSWTTNLRAAEDIIQNGETQLILVTGISDKFILNPEFSNIVSDYKESEIMHIDKVYKYPVYIAIPSREEFKSMFGNGDELAGDHKKEKTKLDAYSTKLLKSKK